MARHITPTGSASQNWRQRMAEARQELKSLLIGQQAVLVLITQYEPTLDRLTFATRWRNAWNCKNADPEFTALVEQATRHFREEKDSYL